jgi:hypothetical protein
VPTAARSGIRGRPDTASAPDLLDREFTAERSDERWVADITEQLYIDCSAAGLGKAPARPIFERGRITLQCISTVFPTFNAAVIGYIEASRSDDEVAKSRLAPTTRYPDSAHDWLPNMRGQLEALRLWNEQPDMADWLESSRLNIARGMFAKAGEPRMSDAITRLLTYSDPANDEPREPLHLGNLSLAARRPTGPIADRHW